MELTVQHPDFSFDELGEFSSEEIRQRLVEHEWAAGREAYIQHMADQGRACPPSLYASKSDSYCLHLYATRDGFEAAVLIPRPKKLWGLFKIAPTSSIVRTAESLDDLLPLVDAFLASSGPQMIELFDRDVV
jgi:hypothetical protein